MFRLFTGEDTLQWEQRTPSLSIFHYVLFYNSGVFAYVAATMCVLT